MEEDVDVGRRPFSGSMERSGYESGCNDDIIKRKNIHKEKRDGAKRQKDDYAAIATRFFSLITPSPMSQRNPAQGIFLGHCASCTNLRNCDLPVQKRVLVESEVMTTAQVQCIEGYHNNKSFKFFASILCALKIRVEMWRHIRNPQMV